MTARAAQAEKTGLRILAAATALFMKRDLSDITLEEIASQAGVTLQTVLRRFGSKSALFDAVVEHTASAVTEARRVQPACDTRTALSVLLADYEQLADLNWRMLCHEAEQPAVARALTLARKMHREWLERVFVSSLPKRGPERERRIELLFTATDFYVWKLQRRDFGRSRSATEAFMHRLVDTLCAEFKRLDAR
jgi:AcrR family transcriptional regulator